MAMRMCGSAADSRGRELVEHGTVAFPVAIYRNDLTAAEVPWHWHEEMETLVVMEGSVVVTAGEKSTHWRREKECLSTRVCSTGGAVFLGAPESSARWFFIPGLWAAGSTAYSGKNTSSPF